MSIFHSIGTWFGYVGSCVATPDATCRPFLAFVALAVAATAALVLLVLAYNRKDSPATTAEVEDNRARLRTLELQDRVRRTLAEQPVKPTLQGRYRIAA